MFDAMKLLQFVAAALAISALAGPALAQRHAADETPSVTQDFDVNAVASMLSDLPRDSVAAPPPSDESAQDHVRALTRRHLSQCWRSPGPGSASVRVQFRLNEDGSVLGQVRVVSPTGFIADRATRAAVGAAREAVVACAPFPFPSDPVAASRYDLWRDMDLLFASP
jgi:hypothetical protein